MSLYPLSAVWQPYLFEVCLFLPVNALYCFQSHILENVFINHVGVLEALKEQTYDIVSALESEKANPMDETTEFGDNSARDKLGFQGWFAPASDYDYPTRYNGSTMSELKMFYGSFYDDSGNIIYRDLQRGFLVGVRNWKEFDVYFPEDLLNTLAQP